MVRAMPAVSIIDSPNTGLGFPPFGPCDPE
jgi:hypothetical protein